MAVTILPFLALCCYTLDAVSAFVMSNSNSIKNLPSSPVGQVPGFYPVSVSPDSFYDIANKYQPLDAYPLYTCSEDDDCALDEFCHSSRNGNTMVCLACRKRRKRCIRDAMCCMGNYCSNGICVPIEQEQERFPQTGYIEDPVVENYHEPATVDSQTKFTTSPSGMQPFKGRDGDVCLRSTDCAPGLCCARHFWSKICKPVLEEGQVCTKHRRKGSHGLEIFQRCHCGSGLSCRLQKGEFTTVPKTSRLHTCQRH
ncbi:dickkopf-related protein 1 [Bombina bombina]|uniref:dickkopf-related protein 1 n=1 Tax=Bombina bombina TaxID=8345 RepID=UPI00235A8765|nr:dickkopf-related protein 1 [Bombina bombina]